MKYLFQKRFISTVLVFVLIACQGISQRLSGFQLLENSIAYHDPHSKWKNFNGVLKINQLDTSNNFLGTRIVNIDRKKDHFKMIQTRGEEQIVRQINNGVCYHEYNGDNKISNEIIKKYQLSCERADMYRNYFSYLYGLPMKLKDSGTIISSKVKETSFLGSPCYELKVNYDENTGSDTWYFYFDRNSYSLIGYRFYHDEVENDGEYIRLEGETVIEGIKIPRDRYWYTNKEEKFLGADLLRN